MLHRILTLCILPHPDQNACMSWEEDNGLSSRLFVCNAAIFLVIVGDRVQIYCFEPHIHFLMRMRQIPATEKQDACNTGRCTAHQIANLWCSCKAKGQLAL